jgi:hypothetical protein
LKEAQSKMALQIKIHGGTPKTGKTLCATCKHAKKVVGQSCQELIFCAALTFPGRSDIVPFRIAECASYHPTNMPWLREMEQMAWIIEARKRGPVGFNDPDSRGDEQMEVVITRPKDSNCPEVAE